MLGLAHEQWKLFHCLSASKAWINLKTVVQWLKRVRGNSQTQFAVAKNPSISSSPLTVSHSLALYIHPSIAHPMNVGCQLYRSSSARFARCIFASLLASSLTSSSVIQCCNKSKMNRSSFSLILLSCGCPGFGCGHLIASSCASRRQLLSVGMALICSCFWGGDSCPSLRYFVCLDDVLKRGEKTQGEKISVLFISTSNSRRCQAAE
jgi:hypothetical protein